MSKQTKNSKLQHFIFHEALNLSIGYMAGLWASNLVSRFFVKKGLSNLWGLASKKEAVNAETYEWLMIATSYVIGLFVLLLVTFAMQQIRARVKKEE